ncbi:MAG: helix-turn-helix domain-containing protein [Turicibacter sp.]|nr:helix-turn-helix domain-containing protein [Turicibacter sp.]
MKISPKIAQNIVERLQDVIGQRINFMDETGAIIASSDQARIGSLHLGALHAMRSNCTLFIESDQQFPGAKKGINMPVFYQESIIGVVGITGGPEVEKFASIVKAMTEILVKEAWLGQLSFQKREKNRLLMESLLLGSDNIQDDMFELDFAKPYRVITGSVTDTLSTNIYQVLEKYFTHFTTNLSYFTILTQQDAYLESTLQSIYEKLGQDVHFGIGTKAVDKTQLMRSYETSLTALRDRGVFGNKGIPFSYFEKLELGILLADAKKPNKELFYQQVFGGLSPLEVDAIRDTLRLYAQHNGSIQKCAEALFIHKNTFQYQLARIKKLTGYDPRNYREFAILYVGLHLQP